MGFNPEGIARTLLPLFVFFLFAGGNLHRAFFPMLFYLLLDPMVLNDPDYRHFAGDRKEFYDPTNSAYRPNSEEPTVLLDDAHAPPPQETDISSYATGLIRHALDAPPPAFA